MNTLPENPALSQADDTPRIDSRQALALLALAHEKRTENKLRMEENGLKREELKQKYIRNSLDVAKALLDASKLDESNAILEQLGGEILNDRPDS